jgi:hypothetical protein
MVKLIEVVGRRSDLTHAQFVKHLTTTHLEVVDRVPEFRSRVRRYMQNILYVEPSEIAPIKGLPISFNADSIIEVWCDSIADIRQAFTEPRYLQIIRPDELAFGDVPGAWGVTVNDTLVMERPGCADLIKLFIFLKRRDGISHPEFLSKWQDARDSQLMAAKTSRDRVGRFVENRVGQDAAESLPGMRVFDVVAEMWFNSVRHIAEFAADPNVIAATVGPQADFTDGTQTLFYVAEERPAAAEWLRRNQAVHERPRI